MTWHKDVEELIHIAHYSTTLKLDRKFKYNIVDKALRSASDILSAESLRVVNNTASVIQWCKQWSQAALYRYEEIDERLTSARDGKPPTHRQICEWRDEFRKRPFTVEHEYPILIPKKGVLDDHWTESQLREWMFEFGRATIITQEENARLLNHTADMQIAAKRYANAKIFVKQHPHFTSK